jgi:hypothetical protein
MTSEEHRIRIELTPEQQSRLKEAAGRDVVAFEFTAEELEERIVPTTFSGDLTFTRRIVEGTP